MEAAEPEREKCRRRYHEAALEQGTVPVKYLPELVRERLKRAR